MKTKFFLSGLLMITLLFSGINTSTATKYEIPEKARAQTILFTAIDYHGFFISHGFILIDGNYAGSILYGFVSVTADLGQSYDAYKADLSAYAGGVINSTHMMITLN